MCLLYIFLLQSYEFYVFLIVKVEQNCDNGEIKDYKTKKMFRPAIITETGTFPI